MSSPIRLKQKLSPEAAKAKAESHLDYDHTTRSFVSVKKNRGGFGKGTKK